MTRHFSSTLELWSQTRALPHYLAVIKAFTSIFEKAVLPPPPSCIQIILNNSKSVNQDSISPRYTSLEQRYFGRGNLWSIWWFVFHWRHTWWLEHSTVIWVCLCQIGTVIWQQLGCLGMQCSNVVYSSSGQAPLQFGLWCLSEPYLLIRVWEYCIDTDLRPAVVHLRTSAHWQWC